VSVFAIIIAGFLIMLAVLGHGVWHGAEVAIASFVVNAFTGAHVSG
jgi:hypothetical protein